MLQHYILAKTLKIGKQDEHYYNYLATSHE